MEILRDNRSGLSPLFDYIGYIAQRYFLRNDKSTLRSDAHGRASCAHRNLSFRYAHFCPALCLPPLPFLCAARSVHQLGQAYIFNGAKLVFVCLHVIHDIVPRAVKVKILCHKRVRFLRLRQRALYVRKRGLSRRVGAVPAKPQTVPKRVLLG